MKITVPRPARQIAFWGVLAIILTIPLSVCAAETNTGDSLAFGNGQTLRLNGIHAPLASTPNLKEQAQKRLEQLIPPEAASKLRLDPLAPPSNRYGQLTAQAYAPASPPVWVQGALLREGLAFVYPPTGNEPNLDDLLAAETEARRARRGIWSDPFYIGIPATELTSKDEGRYAFVRGQIVEAVRIKNKVYLNFGPDWRKDFTVIIAARNLKAFRKSGLDPLALKGQTILVRGWIKHNFGPMIELTHPAQMMVLKEQK
ncbi:MAG: thermonuclease family protein [Bdellovibrionales bacterium]